MTATDRESAAKLIHLAARQIDQLDSMYPDNLEIGVSRVSVQNRIISDLLNALLVLNR